MLYMETILEALRAVGPVTAGATSPIAATADEIGLADVIDRCCEWDKARCKISPGKAIEALVIERRSTVPRSSTRARMWRRSSERGSRLTISTTMPLAEALTRLFAADASRVLSEVISCALEKHDIMVGSTH